MFGSKIVTLVQTYELKKNHNLLGTNLRGTLQKLRARGSS